MRESARERGVGVSLILPILVFLLGASTTHPADREPETEVGKDYRIGVGDMLDIQVWKETSLSRVVPVRPDGKISFPLLDDVSAAGTTPLELKATLTKKLNSFMSDPRVTVIVLEVNSYRVYVMGEVAKPGLLTLKNKTTVVQSIALAGGFTPFARRQKITVIRSSDQRTHRIVIDYDRVIEGRKQEQDLVLEPGDTVVVP
ncbi:MAG TPA: polysaccharide biosynthesis/export family protein [Candidatus Polarisedimenticolia bacterium]|nr:polysaccharide biosynthesis/export family protein [Candidatus Polarisedimenticolia bacterium]